MLLEATVKDQSQARHLDPIAVPMRAYRDPETS
jgi:hypothetical protein